MWPMAGRPPQKNSSALRLGILGAARVAPYALIEPAKTHPDVVIAAVACRDQERGEKYARKYRIPKTYAGANAYRELIADSELDAVYVALPNGLHFEWSMRALEAGKHVLIEKPITNTAEEARQIFALAEKKGLVALEAAHSLFHPAVHRLREIVTGGEMGKLERVSSMFVLPTVLTPLYMHKDDVRFNFDLGGGNMMDMGVYQVSAVQFITGSEPAPFDVTSAAATGHPLDPARIDRGMHATYVLPAPNADIAVETTVDCALPGWGPFGLIPRMVHTSLTFTLERGELYINNFVAPGAFHFIRVKPKTERARFEQAYVSKDGRGNKSWSSWRYQLEGFVDKIRGRTPMAWPEPASVVAKMETLERVYLKAGMPVRKTESSYEPDTSSS